MNLENQLAQISLLCLCLFSAPALSSQQGSAWDLYIENDSKNIGGPGSDSNYTNGAKLSYLYSSSRAPFWAKAHSTFFKWAGIKKTNPTLNYSISLGHQIYTPNDASRSSLIVDDRPYAGWLYTSLSSTVKDSDVAHYFDLNLGMIGPSAMGEGVQKGFHHIIDAEVPQGWKHQLNDELTLQLFYQQRRKWIRERLVSSLSADVIPYWDVGIGNVVIVAGGGLIVRSGYNLPDDFGPSRPTSSESQTILSPSKSEGRKFMLFLFGGLSGKAFAHNIFLDGNTFRHSHSVTRLPLVGEYEFGFQTGYKVISLQWRLVTRGPEFEERRGSHSFASASIRYLSDF